MLSDLKKRATLPKIYVNVKNMREKIYGKYKYLAFKFKLTGKYKNLDIKIKKMYNDGFSQKLKLLNILKGII